VDPFIFLKLFCLVPCHGDLDVACALVTTNEKSQVTERDAPEKYQKDKNK